MERLLSYDYIYLVPLAASAMISLRSFIGSWPVAFRTFSVFLLATLLIEGVAIGWKWGLHHTPYWSYSLNNLWLYNAFLTVRYIFIATFFYDLLNVAVMRRAIVISTSFFLLFSVSNYFFIQTPHIANTYTVIIANIFTIYLVLAFFRQILHDERVIRLTSSTEVWISLGTFLYYSGTLPFFIFFNYLVRTESPVVDSYLLINDFLNVIMYSLYATGFLCKPQFQK